MSARRRRTRLGHGQAGLAQDLELVVDHCSILLPLLLGLVVAAAWSAREGRIGWAFAANTVVIALTVIAIFVTLYPNVMVSSTNPAFNLTVAKTASGNYALEVMTVVAVVFAPFVIVYQGWSHHVFRAGVTGPAVESPETARTSAAG
jgi:cytochrome d ubiquinol oxidase subunit II